MTIANRFITHGCTINRQLPKLYRTWAVMKRRIADKNFGQWGDYGGRGITMHPDWLGRNGYSEFEKYVLSTIGPHPGDKYTIDRYPNNNGNYEPGNVRWATREEQNNHRRRMKDAKSQYYGVTPVDNKFMVRLSYGGRLHYIGRYEDEEIAALHRDIAVSKFKPHNTELNFPDLLPLLKKYIACEAALAELAA